jgi:predicted alpha/beta hydrolase family esterase
MRFVIVPGIGGSDEDHWQTIWQAEWGAAATRISPSSWDEPDLDDWRRAIDRAVADGSSPEVVLVAHSLGCLAATHWASTRQQAVRGLFLVAPPDASGPNFPATAAPTFTTLSATPIEVPGLVVTSDDDPYCGTDAAARLAAAWKTERLSIGLAGHINSAGGLGRWAFGRALLTAFTAGARR